MSKSSTVGQRIVGSVIGLLAGGLAFAALFVALFYRHDSEDDWDLLELIFFGGLGLLIGSIVGAAGGATIVQSFLKQRSSFWKALLGTLAGLLVGGFVGLPLSAVMGHLGGMGWATGALIVPSSMVAGAVIGSGWKAKPDPSSSGIQGVVSPGDVLEPQPGQAKCPFCQSTTFRVKEEAGLRRCSDCHTILPNYILGNAQLVGRV